MCVCVCVVAGFARDELCTVCASLSMGLLACVTTPHGHTAPPQSVSGIPELMLPWIAHHDAARNGVNVGDFHSCHVFGSRTCSA